MEFIKPGFQFDFMGKRWYFIGFSLLLLVLSGVSFIYPGPHMGTDFKGGTEVEVAFKQAVDGGQIRAAVEKSGFSDPDVVSVADEKNPHRFLIRVQQVTVLTDAQKDDIRKRMCLTPENGVAPPECPESLRASEIKFSPGGDKITARYESLPATSTPSGSSSPASPASSSAWGRTTPPS
jgi:preprotein translocase subunit SecF